LCNELNLKELEALESFIEAGKQCIGKLRQPTIDALQRVLSNAQPAAHAAAIALPTSGDDTAGVYELFEEYDQNGDGVLSVDEFTRGCRALLGNSMTDDQISALMKSSDVNSSGDIDIHEFIVWLYGESKVQREVDPSLCSVGSTVKIGGLKGAVELNGKTGVVCGFNEDSGRCIVELHGGDGQKSLRVENLAVLEICKEWPSGSSRQNKYVDLPKIASEKPQEKPPQQRQKSEPSREPKPDSIKVGDFNIGDRVRIGGLNGAKDLNGQLGVIFGMDKESGRYIVEFENGAGQKKLRRDNLTAMGTATGAIAAKARMFAGL